MNTPLYAIIVQSDADYRKKILDGVVTATIRKDYRDYRRGWLMLCSYKDDAWAVLADLVSVTCTGIRKLDPEDLKAAGFDTLEEFKAWWTSVYAEPTGQEGVTIIRWENVRGKLKEAA